LFGDQSATAGARRRLVKITTMARARSLPYASGLDRSLPPPWQLFFRLSSAAAAVLTTD